MRELLHQLGIDWRLLLSQAANFLILLVVLRVFAYKPILKVLKDRKQRIEEGIAKAKEADIRLHESNAAAKEKMKQAEQEVLVLMRAAEENAKKREVKLLKEAGEKKLMLMKEAERVIEARREEASREMQKKAAELVKAAIIKTVELDPAKIDDALIQKAISEVR